MVLLPNFNYFFTAFNTIDPQQKLLSIIALQLKKKQTKKTLFQIQQALMPH